MILLSVCDVSSISSHDHFPFQTSSCAALNKAGDSTSACTQIQLAASISWICQKTEGQLDSHAFFVYHKIVVMQIASCLLCNVDDRYRSEVQHTRPCRTQCDNQSRLLLLHAHVQGPIAERVVGLYAAVNNLHVPYSSLQWTFGVLSMTVCHCTLWRTGTHNLGKAMLPVSWLSYKPKCYCFQASNFRNV